MGHTWQFLSKLHHSVPGKYGWLSAKLGNADTITLPLCYQYFILPGRVKDMLRYEQHLLLDVITHPYYNFNGNGGQAKLTMLRHG